MSDMASVLRYLVRNIVILVDSMPTQWPVWEYICILMAIDLKGCFTIINQTVFTISLSLRPIF